MSEQNKALTRQFVDEVISKGNLDAAEQFMSSDYVEHNAPPGTVPGLEGFKQAMRMLRAAFPDMHFTVEDIIAEGDMVVVRGTGHGTHKGEFMGIPPTGKQITVSEIHISRIADGKIVEHWGIEDALGMLQQLGVVPPQ